MRESVHLGWIIFAIGLMKLRVTADVFRRANATKELRIAWLAPRKTYHDFNASTSVGGLLLALNNIMEQPNWLKGYNLNVHWFDSDCSSKEGLAVAVKAKVAFRPHVFLGPPCSKAMRGVAQLASSWNLPIFGWISSDIDLSDKQTFSTLVRLQGPLDTIVTTMRYISRMFKWNRFALIYDHQSRYEAVEKAILSGQKKGGYYMTSSHKVSILSSDEEVKNIFKQIRKYARIIIFAVPWMDMRQYMLIAYELDMAGGDYVFLCMHSDVYIGKRFSEEVVSDRGWRRGDKDDKKARVAFESVLHIINPTLSKEVYQNYQKRISELDYRNENWNLPAITSVDAYAPFLFDATMVWAFLANKSIAKNINPENGSHIFEEAKYFESDGLTQAIALDEKGDRFSNIWILDMVPEGQFQVVMEIYNQATGGKLTTGRNQSGDVRWGSGKYGRENAPRDEPVCGFEGDLCPENKQTNIRVFFPIVMTVSVTIGLILCGFACHRSFYLKRVRNERPAWKVDPGEIMFKQTIGEGSLRASFMSLGRRRSSKKNPFRKLKNSLDNYGLDIRECSMDVMGLQETGDQSTSNAGEVIPYPPTEGVLCHAAIIRGGLVYAKKIADAAITFNEGDQHRLTELVEIKHSNIAMFVGACVGPSPAYIFWEYCSKGSLRDIIKNINIRLDDMFKFALCQDIAKGLDFLHKSEVHEHGNLKSCNCVVDSRWTCKLVDFGLRFLKHNKPIEERIAQTPSELYWTAPEVLRGMTPGYLVKADMYALGVIIKEVFTRKSPYQEYGLNASEVISRVKTGPRRDTELFRPSTDIVRNCRSESEERVDNDFSSYPPNCAVKDAEESPASLYTNVFHLARGCWAEEPSCRPTAGRVYKALLRLNPNRNLSMIDNMVGLLETYANHLEDLVVERTEELNVEKSKVETLLFKLLPKEVAQTLKSGKDVKAEYFEEASIYFSDIVGFTKICAQSSPIEVVNLLNLLYQTFDNLIEKFDVYKVETIGDAYMIASGVPKRNGKRHIKEIVDCAIDLLNSIRRVKIPHMPGRHLKIRIGIHSGAVVGGVVGNKMPRYCLFGDTVNVASRMESTGVPMCIHMSSFAKRALDAFPGYITECRGDIEVKGKGLMTTYFIISSQEYRVVLCDDNGNETLQETDDAISKMSACKMKEDNERFVSDEDSLWGMAISNDAQPMSTPLQKNGWKLLKDSSGTKYGNVVSFGGCSLITNENCQRKPENLTNDNDDEHGKRQRSKRVISETSVSSILKNVSQQRMKNQPSVAEGSKCLQSEASRNTETVALETDVNGCAGRIRASKNFTNFVSASMCKDNAKNRVSDAPGQNVWLFEEPGKEAEEEVDRKLPHPQKKRSFSLNTNICCFQNQIIRRNSTSNCTSLCKNNTINRTNTSSTNTNKTNTNDKTTNNTNTNTTIHSATNNVTNNLNNTSNISTNTTITIDNTNTNTTNTNDKATNNITNTNTNRTTNTNTTINTTTNNTTNTPTNTDTTNTNTTNINDKSINNTNTTNINTTNTNISTTTINTTTTINNITNITTTTTTTTNITKIHTNTNNTYTNTITTAIPYNTSNRTTIDPTIINKIKPHQNPNLPIVKNDFNYDASNYINNLQNPNKSTNPLLISPGSTRAVDSFKYSNPTSLSSDGESLFSVQTRDIPELLTNQKTFNKTRRLPDTTHVVTFQPHVWCGTHEDKSVAINMTITNDEITFL